MRKTHFSILQFQGVLNRTEVLNADGSPINDYGPLVCSGPQPMEPY